MTADSTAGPDVVLFDYGSGNLRSAHRALERAGAKVTLTDDLDRAEGCEGLVLPGVGAFAACMKGIAESGVDRVVRERFGADRPVFGICVGHQVMFSSGTEHGVTVPGIGILPGSVDALRAPRLPHMGWNTVEPGGLDLFDGLGTGERYYFVHTYGAKGTLPDGARAAIARHGEDFIAAVEYGSLSSTQFHPEKSGDAGARLLANWIERL
ncbi:imidazole glycerol phosphate synthase subunit HisH [Salininema proteolyticum]|uniref:Imidazole glycerol phosphate synthase subunit HisH n=1 Tax=Salininema proteolyticum TaxID=1607685 RepID=A0ABV8TW99_9ACTN